MGSRSSARSRAVRARRALVPASLALLAIACRVETDEPAGLRVLTDVRPAIVSASDYRRGLDVTLMATNRGGRRIRVAQRRPFVAGDTARVTPVGFGLRIVRGDGRAVREEWQAARDTVVALHGGQTLRAHFHLDFGGGTGEAIPPGDYRVIGSFGAVEAPAVRLRVRP